MYVCVRICIYSPKLFFVFGEVAYIDKEVGDSRYGYVLVIAINILLWPIYNKKHHLYATE
jgi:hypothetical protein